MGSITSLLSFISSYTHAHTQISIHSLDLSITTVNSMDYKQNCEMFAFLALSLSPVFSFFSFWHQFITSNHHHLQVISVLHSSFNQT